MSTPIWLSLVLAGIPLVGVVLAALLLRRTGHETVQVSEEALANAVSVRLDARLSALELDTWRRREETMRMLRWSAEQATAADDRLASVGTGVLIALGRSELVQPQDGVLVDAVLEVILSTRAREYDETSTQAGDDAVVIDLDDREGGADHDDL